MGSERVNPLVRIDKDVANSPIERKIAMRTFTPSFTDLLEYAGFRRKRPRTKTEQATTNNVINPTNVINEIRFGCAALNTAMAVVAPVMGIAISQLFTSMTLISLNSPEGAFRYKNRLSFP